MYPLQVLHEHEIDHEAAVEEVDFFVHHTGKQSRLTLHDENITVRPLPLVWRQVFFLGDIYTVYIEDTVDSNGLAAEPPVF